MSAHDPISPTSAGQTDWATLLDELARRAQAGSGTGTESLPIGWKLHAWAHAELDSAAIRIDGTEGLIGPAPARWRLLCHVDGPPEPREPADRRSKEALAVAILDGRAPLHPTNVLASLLVAPERPAIVTVRGRAAEVAPAREFERDRTAITTPSAALTGIVDLILGRCARASGSATALPAALRLAAALALGERGFGLAWTIAPRRGTRRPRAFVANRDPAKVRRQLAAVEAALRKRDRNRR